MKLKLLFICMLVLVSFSSFTFAAKINNLYTVEMSVISQSSEVRTKAAKQGLAAVLTKVSGQADIETNPKIKESLNRAEYFVQEYSYTTSPDSPAYILKIRFNAVDIERMLKKAGARRWGEDRPLILVWVAYTDQNQHVEIVGHDNNRGLMYAIKNQAKKFGLPIIFPMLDVVDYTGLSANDVMQFNLALVKRMSHRYDADGLLIGAITEQDHKAQSRWILLVGKQQWTWSIAGAGPSSIVQSSIDQASQALVKYYVTDTDAASLLWVKLQVTNIKKRSELATLLKELNKISALEQAELSEVQGDVVQLDIQVKGTLAFLQEQLKVNRHLTLKSQDEDNHQLTYEWSH